MVFRYDSEQTQQVWNSCANIEIVDASSTEPAASGLIPDGGPDASSSADDGEDGIAPQAASPHSSNQHQPHRQRDPELCAALEAALPDTCTVDDDCWGFGCAKTVFQVPMVFECDLSAVCAPAPAGPAVQLGVQAPESGAGPWTYGLTQEEPVLREPMEGLGFPNLPGCGIDAQAYATGQMTATESGQGARTALSLNLGVDACCEEPDQPPICGEAAKLFPAEGWDYDFTQACSVWRAVSV